MKKIGIFGGSFNPIHIGHLILAQEVQHQAGLEKVLFIPTNDNPLKEKDTKETVAERYEMTRLAIEDNENFVISDLEIRQPGFSYTIDTVKKLKSIDSKADYYFLCGEDIIFQLERWKDFEELFQLVTFIVTYRPGYDFKKLETEAVRLKQLYDAKIKIFQAPLIDISSTAIRERVVMGKSIRYLVTEKVHQYIKEKQLYLE